MNESINKQLLDQRTFKIKRSAQTSKRRSSLREFKAFYEAMDFLTLYEAGYNKLGLEYIIHLDIPKFLLDEYTQQVWDVIQEFEELIKIFGLNTMLEANEVQSEFNLIVSIYQSK